MKDIFDSIREWDKCKPYTKHSTVYYVTIKNSVNGKEEIKERYGTVFHTDNGTWIGAYKNKGGEHYVLTEISTGLRCDKPETPLKTFAEVVQFLVEQEDFIKNFLLTRAGMDRMLWFDEKLKEYKQ